MPDKASLRLEVVQHACQSKCLGHPGNSGGCCKLGPRDWIIGPVRDVEAFLARLSELLGRPALRVEVLIDHEEGRALFPERSTWQNPDHYPALRVRADAPHACLFHDDVRGCTIHPIRPAVCKNYECGWLKTALDSLF
jgi:Fe-S-cluster containining protein